MHIKHITKCIKIGCFAGCALIILFFCVIYPRLVQQRDRRVLHEVIEVVAEAKLRQWADSKFCNLQHIDSNQIFNDSSFEHVGKKYWGDHFYMSTGFFLYDNNKQLECVFRIYQWPSSLIIFEQGCTSDDILRAKTEHNRFYEVGDKIFWTGFLPIP